ncbi:MAG: nucleotidyltransferase domain-containing protein [Chloroflexota bacterium]
MIAQTQIDDVSDRIVRYHAPDRIILFGSYAYGVPDEGSDVDLLVVLPFDGKPFRKAAQIQSQVHAGFPLDVIAVRPADLERRYREADPLIRDALDRGRVLYERRS